GFSDGNEPCAALPGSVKFGLRLLDRWDPRKMRSASRDHEFRQHLQCEFRRAESVDEIAKGGGSNVLGADQPKPVDPLPVAEARGARGRVISHPFVPIRASVPESRREIFARCLMKTIRLIAANTNAKS